LRNREEYLHYAASLAQRSILYEVSTTPKPGLVDRENSGAHKDMDFFTFMASSSALYRGLYECAECGFEFSESDNINLIDKLRIPGIQCEKEMFKATDGVNTHKGVIFSLGILCAAAGKLYRECGAENYNAETICEKVKEIAIDLTARDFKGIQEKKLLTHGEMLYKRYGFKGIRGEVESGFATVRESAVPILRYWYSNKTLSMNDIFLQVLINLMAESEDTNVIIRGGVESLIYTKTVSKEFLQSGGMKQPYAKEKLEQMNRNFVEKNISPGGAADLLAVSIFFGLMEGIIK
jgi:triphosphoribosyl-dephospho-CoA synthase